MLTYANVLDRVEQILQDTSNATYDVTELGFWIEDGLKEFSTFDPHIVPIIFKIESRTGIETAGTASSLTDDTKSQFLASDATQEKVVHNLTDNTWATIVSNSSTSVNTLSIDIMDSGENYRIYNKRCWNQYQIYIGDVTDYLWVDSVEYPIGQKRNFKVQGEILEIDVSRVNDSDSTLDIPQNIDVLVRFAKPHRLCQLTDLDGTCTNIEPVDETTLAVENLGTTETIEIGDEFFIADQRTLYTVTKGILLSSGAGDITVYPGMVAATATGEVITFTQSTLKPQHEVLFQSLVVAKALLSDSKVRINVINKGGPEVWSKFRQAAFDELSDVRDKLERIKKRRIFERFPTA